MTPEEVRFTPAPQEDPALHWPATEPTTALLRVSTPLPAQQVSTLVAPICDHPFTAYIGCRAENYKLTAVSRGKIRCAIVMVSSLKMLEIFHPSQVSKSQLPTVKAMSSQFKPINYAV
jgi:hypothetical protein